MINPILVETNFDNLGKLIRGKVRDVYEQESQLLLVTTDRHSSFDRNIAHIPHKGAILTQMSMFWFEQTKDIIPNHIIAQPDPNVVVVKKCTLLPIEVIVRGYLTGVTSTSIWKNYSDGKRDFGDFMLPDGMVKNQALEENVVTPTTKLEEHDRNLTSDDIISEGLLSQEHWDYVSSTAKKLFLCGQEIAAKAGYILVDTKYEFGMDQEENILLIDEVHTPDSSRYWKMDSYQERIAEGQEPENFDKEFLRLWFKENCDPYNDEVLPAAPEELILELSRRYKEIYNQITGQEFSEETGDILARMESNLTSYTL